MIIIEGPRNVGKTYMISKLGYQAYKIAYSSLVKGYEENQTEQAGMFSHGLSVGKDLTMLEMNKLGLIPMDAIFDRGFISTIVYDRIFNRCENKFVISHLNTVMNRYLIPDKGKSIGIIFVFGKNPEDRVKDEMDGLDYDLQAKEYWAVHDMFFSDSIVVTNEFDDKSIEEFKEAIFTTVNNMMEVKA